MIILKEALMEKLDKLHQEHLKKKLLNISGNSRKITLKISYIVFTLMDNIQRMTASTENSTSLSKITEIVESVEPKAFDEQELSVIVMLLRLVVFQQKSFQKEVFGKGLLVFHKLSKNIEKEEWKTKIEFILTSFTRVNETFTLK